ncbi:MAG TPA: hypothetical protein VJL10_08955 [Anaerolineales bacterium]|nr:hypothetical protein [Anaerolineales bacterium]
MDDGLRPEKSTGYTLPTPMGKESALAPVESTAERSGSLVLIDAPMKDESLISTAEVSASKILAVQVMMGDFRALKAELPASRQASGNGKIYWSAELPGHTLSIMDGILLVDNEPASILIEKLLAEE